MPSRTRRLRALYLTHHAPWPVTSGGRLRDAALVPRLAQGADLEVWAVSRQGDEDRAAVADHADGTVVRVFDDESTRHPYPTRDSWVARRSLARAAAEQPGFDVVHVEGHYLFHLLPEQLARRSVVVEHNVESHLIEQRMGLGAQSPQLLQDLATVRASEEHVWRTARLVLTLSDEDMRRVSTRVPEARVRRGMNGADHVPAYPAQPRNHSALLETAPRICFLANFAYLPNQDALDWLIRSIFPRIQSYIPGAELLLAGSGSKEALQKYGSPMGVRALGWIDDLSDVWSTADVMVSPLRIGGGVKVKMIESIRGGCLTVATTLSMEGLPRAADSAVVVRDDPDEFVEGVVSLCKDDDFRAQRAASLHRVQKALPSWSDAAADLVSHWSTIH
ncbi:glycosyltransferase family 4 protein [Streptomyces sp. NBC_01210]|uniref:glycosyltransferase n=1 Tax=Streptomyces sp. NBC_01210 TaxID=2903774 RepID=UPI002E13EF12|nr:glycosyltransferase family 4 protein [Streptomyces sp. NBC_01210]